MEDKWTQPPSSAVECLVRGNEAFSIAKYHLGIARGRSKRDWGAEVGDHVTPYYLAAQTELAFAEYYERRAKELRGQRDDAPSDSIERQDPNTD